MQQSPPNQQPMYHSMSSPTLQSASSPTMGMNQANTYLQQQEAELSTSPNNVLVMPQHPYAMDRCGLNPRDKAIYNPSSLRISGSIPVFIGNKYEPADILKM